MIEYAGIDLSLRSTGVVVCNGFGVRDFGIVSYPDFAGTTLLKLNAEAIIAILKKWNPKHINLEGLSFGAISGNKDILAGNFWYLRVQLRDNFPTSEIEIVPVTRWRKYIISPIRAKELKESGEKNFQKKEVVRKLPEDAKREFENYIKLNRLKKDSIYDLADAYFLSQYTINSQVPLTRKSKRATVR